MIVFPQCSTQCTKGLKIREVTCAARNGTKINNIYCRGRKPSVVRICNENKRCGNWEVGPWGKVNDREYFDQLQLLKINVK